MLVVTLVDHAPCRATLEAEEVQSSWLLPMSWCFKTKTDLVIPAAAKAT